MPRSIVVVDSRAAESLANLAARVPVAARTFQRRGLDFYCSGRETLAEACERCGVPIDAVLAELKAGPDRAAEYVDPFALPLEPLIEHVLTQYHAPHRLELPRLAAMSREVELRYANGHDGPRPLSAALSMLAAELETHMQKEEHVLFPLALAGRGRMAAMPVQAMEQEHRDAARLLLGLRRATYDYVLSVDAPPAWFGLYAETERFELELMRHIHLENYALFPRILMS